MTKRILILAVMAALAFGMVAPATAEVQVANGGIGDALLFSLYDVRDVENRTAAWQNYITIENTTGHWVAAHIRFRSWRKSIEVYDHVILLSPYDVFWAYIYRATAVEATTDNPSDSIVVGDVVIASEDTNTLRNSGLIYTPQTAWKTKFQSSLLEDSGFTTAAGYDLQKEIQAGYLEVIGLWQLMKHVGDEVCGAPIYDEDTHLIAQVVSALNYQTEAPIVANVYDMLDAGFWVNAQALPYPAKNGIYSWPDTWGRPKPSIEGSETGTTPASPRWFHDCGNVLTGAMEFGDPGNGRYELENFVALQDFRTDDGPYWCQTAHNYTALTHRDEHRGGEIIFPTDSMRWWVYTNAPGYYVNSGFATSVGPDLRDGDHLNVGGVFDNAGYPDNNVTQGASWPAFATAINVVDSTYTVDRHNDIWSLDDVEWALFKNEIWYHYYAGDPFGDGATLITDVNITFPTKHYHWYFANFPYWGRDTQGPAANFDGTGMNNGSSSTAVVRAYWAAFGSYLDGILDGYRGSSLLDRCTTGSIEFTWDYCFENGPVSGEVNIWDDDQNTETPPPGNPPPGSPFHPDIPNPEYIPHEVNIIRVGADQGTGTGIDDGNGILDTDFTMGHFRIGFLALQNGLRDSYTFGAAINHAIYWDSTKTAATQTYVLPPIGVVELLHQYSSIVVVRSAMADWHWKFNQAGIDE